jgi:Ribosomal protein S18
MPKRQSGNKKSKQSNFAKLSIFQPNKYKFKKTCPLSAKGAPEVNYKNVKLLKKYVSKNGKFYLQESQMYLKRNRENFLFQLKELET